MWMATDIAPALSPASVTLLESKVVNVVLHPLKSQKLVLSKNKVHIRSKSMIRYWHTFGKVHINGHSYITAKTNWLF